MNKHYNHKITLLSSFRAFSYQIARQFPIPLLTWSTRRRNLLVRSSLLSVSDSELSADAAVAAAAVPTTDPVTCKELVKYIFSIPLPKDLWGPMLANQ